LSRLGVLPGALVALDILEFSYAKVVFWYKRNLITFAGAVYSRML